jgi:hypothetical protein
MRKLFRYLSPLWTGKDKRISLRSAGAIALLIDFIINVHNASYVVVKVLNLIILDKTIDPLVIGSLAGYLAQIALILGIEAGLIAALMGLKTYQNNVEFLKSNSANINQNPPPLGPEQINEIKT